MWGPDIMDSRTSEKARMEWFGKSSRQVNFYHLGVLLLSFATSIVLCMASDIETAVIFLLLSTNRLSIVCVGGLCYRY